MEQEISSGTMLGIVLIALAAVIGLGFGVFSIAKGVANEGTVGVQDNLGSVSDSAYDDYNDKIVTGTMVKSAVTNFKGKSCAILINTTAMDKGVVAYKEHQATLTAYKYSPASGSGADAKEANIQKVDLVSGTGGLTTLATDAIAGGTHYYINYNALFDTAAFSGTGAGKLYLKDGIYNAESAPYGVDNTGKVKFDYSTGGMTRTGNCEYLNATAKFDANLIKDETGTILGIVFTQRAQ